MTHRTEWSVAALLSRVTMLESALAPVAKLAPMFAARNPATRVLSTAVGDLTVADILAAKHVLEHDQAT